MKRLTEEEILQKMTEAGAKHGFVTNENGIKIARAKKRMFVDTVSDEEYTGEEWKRCPCDGNNPARFCVSDLCQSDVRTKGVCHCNCHRLKK